MHLRSVSIGRCKGVLVALTLGAFFYGAQVRAANRLFATRSSTKVPALPSGVSELKFRDFFVNPVGPAGLALTEKVKDLEGKRVRILGYMVQKENKCPGTFLLTPLPVQLHEEHYGLADDLPAATLFVFDAANRDKYVKYTPNLLRVTGILSLGNREESDGRISVVRLTLHPARSATTKNHHASRGGSAALISKNQRFEADASRNHINQ
jgi:hypothetical protein